MDTTVRKSSDTRTPYEKWQDTVRDGVKNTAWDEYDEIIKTAVSKFNSRLGKTSRFVEKPMPILDWKWVKTMIWVESGGPTNSAWTTRPIQIGNKNDKGWDV